MNPTNETFIQRTLELALAAAKKGNHPFGAILVHEKNILLEAENTVVTEKDPTQHAELRLISQASRTFDREIIKHCTLFSSTEPCAMCCGAIYWSGIRRLVYGCSEKTLGKYAGKDFLIPSADLFQYAQEPVHITGPILEALSAQVHSDFWNKKVVPK